MNNFDENQNIEITEEADELSTVFADPTAHKVTADSKKNPNKKRIMSVIAGVLAVAVLIGGTVAVVKLIPEKEDDDGTTSQAPEITVLSMKEAEIKNLTVKNKNGSFVMNNKVTKDDDGYDECVWALEGYDTDVISDYALYDIATNFTSLSAMREITTKTAEECGLNNPAVDVTITKQDNAVVNVIVGAKSPDGSGVYVKLSGKETIYLVSGAIDEDLTFTALDLANTNAIAALTLPSGNDKYLTNGTISSFDSLTISGKNFSEKVVIKPNPDEVTTELHAFVITSPTDRMAENVDKALAVFNASVNVSGAYALDSKTATLNKLGLNKPDLEITAKFGKNSYTFKFKKQDDGNYAVWYTDCKMIKMVAADSLEVLSYSTNSFYSTWVHLQSINDLKGFIVKSEGKEYKFDISVKVNEDTANDYTIKHNGKTLTASNFQNFYRYCISLYASDFEIGKITTDPEYEITFVYSDAKRASTKIKFYRSSATKYLFSVNGEVIGHVNASDLNRIATYVKQVAKDETVNVI
ncbi:MAG: DUF4340 domain-containing protein [Ruminococcaceae bacterium]|nr:DUF4340 domain-containing protein [Oscillospiraceae bacterium]